MFQGILYKLPDLCLHFCCLTSKIAIIRISLSCLGNENVNFLLDQELLESRDFLVDLWVTAPRTLNTSLMEWCT